MAVLLCSLGISWAVVPEAFSLPEAQFKEVHVLTSSDKRTEESAEKVREYFASRHPKITLSVTHIDQFKDLRTSEDHELFEEVLLRWILAKAPSPSTRYLCLAGGFKTMSASMQRAAGFFGAAEVFHVLADNSINTPDLVDKAIAEKAINFVRLGLEPGWPTAQGLKSDEFPLIEVAPNCVRADGYDLSNRIDELNSNQRNLSGNFDVIAELPFTSLAMRASTRLEWLRSRLQPNNDGHVAWIQKLPKIELHCHLGGFATHGSLLHEVHAAASNPNELPPLNEPPLPSRWPSPEIPIPLLDYMHLGDANGSTLLKDPGCLKKHCELLYSHFIEQNILYAEVRCSPANYATPTRSAWTALQDIKSAFDSQMDQHPNGPRINLILIATRREKGDYRTHISRHLALAATAAEHWSDENTCRVVGVDLAGYEDKETRAHYYRDDFRVIHRAGLALTIHAGENDDAEGIWSAVFDLNTRRIGHALSLQESPQLMRSVADRHIAIEMCPYANYQIKGFSPMPDQTAIYPLKRYLDAGIAVTINTDNIGISAASISDNLRFAAKLCPDLTPLDILQCQRNAIDAAFVSPKVRRHLTQQFTRQLAT